MKNEDKLKLAKKKSENKQNTQAIADDVKAIAENTKQRYNELAEIKEAIKGLSEALNVNVEINDLSPLISKLKSLENLPDSFTDIKNMSLAISNKLQHLVVSDQKKVVSVRGFPEFNKRFENFEKNFIENHQKFTDLSTYIKQLSTTLKQGQLPEDYKPVRLVIGGDGIPLKFLQDMPTSRAGGGGSGTTGGATANNQTDGSQKTQIVDAGGEAATVTDGKLDVNASVNVSGQAAYSDSGGTDRKGLVDADRHVQADVLTLPSITGTVTANKGTGWTDPQTDALTDAQLRASAVPISHTALTELAGAIDTEMQVDIVASLPAGINNIGDVDIASIAAGDNNIGNVDVVTLPSIPAGTNNIGDVDVASIAQTALTVSGASKTTTAAATILATASNRKLTGLTISSDAANDADILVTVATGSTTDMTNQVCKISMVPGQPYTHPIPDNRYVDLGTLNLNATLGTTASVGVYFNFIYE